MSSAPWTVEAAGLRLTVRLTPKSTRDAIEGVELRDDGRAVLKARVRAAPEDGKANDALIRLLAATLDVPARAIKLASGAASRQKVFRIDGDVAKLTARLEALVAPAQR